jgi:hypothetical protein
MRSHAHSYSRRSFAALFASARAPVALPVPTPATPSNVQVTHDDFSAHIEPTVAVNPREPDNLLAACRVFTGGQITVAAYASFDAGRTWQGAGPLPGLVPGAHGNATAAFDERGRGYVCAVAAHGDQRSGDALLWRTDDAGRSFRDPIVAISGGGGLVDHPWLVTGSPADLFIAARMFGTTHDGIALARSTDGGRSFAEPRVLDDNGGAAVASPVLAIGPSGCLCIVYAALARSGGMLLRALSSADRGQTFAAPSDLVETESFAPNLGGVTAKSGPAIAASPSSDVIYAVATSFDDASGVSRLLLVQASAGGRVWSPPTTVAHSTDTIYLQPQVAVDKHGRAAISVYAVSIARARIDVVVYSDKPGSPQHVTTRSFDPRDAIDTGSTAWLGNYQALVGAPAAAFHPLWTDTRTGGAQIFTATVHI